MLSIVYDPNQVSVSGTESKINFRADFFSKTITSFFFQKISKKFEFFSCFHLLGRIKECNLLLNMQSVKLWLLPDKSIALFRPIVCLLGLTNHQQEMSKSCTLYRLCDPTQGQSIYYVSKGLDGSRKWPVFLKFSTVCMYADFAPTIWVGQKKSKIMLT